MELLFSEIGARISAEFGPVDARRGGGAREPALAPVLDLARDLGRDLPGEDLPGRVLERALAMARADYGFLFLTGDDGTPAQAARAESAGSSGGAIFSYGQQAVDDVVRTGRYVLADEVAAGKPSSGRGAALPRTVLAAPVAARGKMIGVCYLGRRGPEYTSRDAGIITAFLEYAGLVLEGRSPGGAEGEPTAVTDFSRDRVRRAIAYIDENYRYDISREGLASSLGISPYYLGKAFKELTGKKLGDYINEARVREASRRLSDTDESIIDIAYAVGFETLRTFNRAFRRVTGMAPSEYREKR